ncbi:hypothetical protein SCHPADRAFT_935405 [Schizopora paradoxa]|uniref:Membrane-associated proteins in eicosanoid and glutathione metabolism n=1 Tax=Schizopora paradoxa TaxID=27342 RepID=A0A0H2SQF6_9AGAM|nr:hypothetical protein SCHPADRAFT_935405 [Schizopora paradoxa]
MSFSLDSPLSLYSIPVVWFTTFYPMNMKFRLITKHMGYNNCQPRANTKKILESGSVPKDIAARAERLEGAHLNGNEILPMWIGAVLAGNLVGLPNSTLNTASAVFIALRICYNTIYINHTTAGLSNLRTVVWLASMGVPITLFVKAANLLHSKSA